GTAAEITPVRSVDRKSVGNGTPGPITRALQQAFFGLFDGRTEDRQGWLEYVDVEATRRELLADGERVRAQASAEVPA
ncbi:MAG: branched chain amino acid aminotransferase, partial [Rhodanobacter sp.]